jgi:hypothetical protein
MGGSLGGDHDADQPYHPTDRYLRKIVSWSARRRRRPPLTGPGCGLAAVTGMTQEAFSPEPPGDHKTESS